MILSNVLTTFRNARCKFQRQAWAPDFFSATLALAMASPVVAQSLPTNLVSQGVNGETANGRSLLGEVGGSGFDVVFTSTATNLIENEAEDPAFSRVYLHKETSLLPLRQISRGIGAAANGSSRSPSLSRDGQHVVFASDASNLIANDNNLYSDIFAVFADSFESEQPDPALTVRLSTNQFGTAPNDKSRYPVISGNARHVLFESRASNLDLGSGINRNHFDLFVVDRDSDNDGVFDEVGTLQPVRIVQSENGLASPGAFRGFDISGDGRYVVFSTAFLGVTADPVTATYNVYFHDRDTDLDGIYDEAGAVATTLLSRAAPIGAALSMDADYPEIDADGVRVIFHSRAPEIQTSCASGTDCSIFIADIPADGPDFRFPESATIVRGLAGRPGRNARLNVNGTLLTYTSSTQPRELRLYNIQATTDTPLCLSQHQRTGNRGCGIALAGQNAQYVSIDSSSSNLVPLDVNAQSDLFIRNTIASPPPSPASTACDDQIDNDGNNLIDLDDPGCFAPEDDNEAPGEIVKLVTVTQAANRLGAYTVVDQQGRPGENPDFSLSPNSMRHAAYSATAFEAGLTPGVFFGFDQLRTSLFEPFAGQTTLREQGTSPRTATDSQSRLHIVYEHREEGLPIALAYAVGENATPQRLPVPGTCSSGAYYNPALVLDSTEAPVIPFFDSCINEIKVWRPSLSVTTISTPHYDIMRHIDAAIGVNDELVLAYANRSSVSTSSNRIVLMRLNSSDVVLNQQNEDELRPVNSLDVGNDVSGTGHAAVTLLSDDADVSSSPAMVYFHEQSGAWLREELFLPEGRDYRVQLRFAADGLTPIFILTRDFLLRANEVAVRQFTFANGQFSELDQVSVPGAVDAISLDQRDDGSYEFVYQDAVSGNVVHVDPDAPAWMSDTADTATFTDLRDLSLPDQPSLFSDLPNVLTFSASSPGAAGQLALHQRVLGTAEWESQVIGSAYPQDAVDLSENGLQLVQFFNSDKSLRYFEQIQPGVWSQSILVTLTGFSSIDNVHVSGYPSGRVEVFGIQRSGDGESGDRLIVYARNNRTDPWQAFPFDSNPVTDITEAQARTPFVAYVDGQQADLHLARFNRITGLWSSEPVDTDISPINIGKTVSLQVIPERFRASGTQAPDGVPTIAYRKATRNRIRYAMKANAWRIWEYEESLPVGVSIDGIDHQLINDSRLRPLIAARLSDGNVYSYRRTGGAAADDADSIQIERELIAADGSDGGGLGLVRLVQTAETNVAYSSAGTETRLAVGNRATGLPAAIPAIAHRQSNNSRSNLIGDLSPAMCICFIGDIFGLSCSGDEPREINSVDGLQLTVGNSGVPDSNVQDSDEQILGQWGTLFQRTAAGQSYIDFYARDYPKIARLVAQDPGLLIDGIDTLQNFMPGIRAMVGGFGDQVFLTQQMIDDGLDIWQRLADRDDGTLSAFIEGELLIWNNMQDFVGLSFDQWGTMIGLQVGVVGGSDVLFADSFED